MATPTSRNELIEYVYRELGDPVLEINVDIDQVEDRVDDALTYFKQFHTEGTYRTFLKHEVTQTDIDNEYIPVSANVMFLTKMFPVYASALSRGMFDIRYQMHMNDIANMHTYIGDLAYYEQIQSYISLLDMRLNGSPQVNFSRNQGRLYIHGEFVDKDIKVGDYVVAEVYEILDPDTYAPVWNDIWLKEYTTALVKRQWGQNLSKFEGMQLPGGVMFNGRQLMDDANSEIERLREELRSTYEMPVDFFVG